MSDVWLIVNDVPEDAVEVLCVVASEDEAVRVVDRLRRGGCHVDWRIDQTPLVNADGVEPVTITRIGGYVYPGGQPSVPFVEKWVQAMLVGASRPGYVYAPASDDDGPSWGQGRRLYVSVMGDDEAAVRAEFEKQIERAVELSRGSAARLTRS